MHGYYDTDDARRTRNKLTRVISRYTLVEGIAIPVGVTKRTCYQEYADGNNEYFLLCVRKRTKHPRVNTLK